jgi:hypothetical protein
VNLGVDVIQTRRSKTAAGYRALGTSPAALSRSECEGFAPSVHITGKGLQMRRFR